MPGWALLSWAPCSRLKAGWNAAQCKGAALQPLSKPQWRMQCCEASGALCLRKPRVKREVAHLNTHTESCFQSYFCKNDKLTQAESATNCRTYSVSQSMLNIMWHPFKSCSELKYSVGVFFFLPTENMVYCYLNSIYFCNSLLMQGCFSLGPWIYANRNEEKSWSRKEAQ